MAKTKKKHDPSAPIAAAIDSMLLHMVASRQKGGSAFPSLPCSPLVPLDGELDTVKDAAELEKSAGGLRSAANLERHTRPFRSAALFSDPDNRSNAFQVAAVEEASDRSIRLVRASGMLRGVTGPLLRLTMYRFGVGGSYVANSTLHHSVAGDYHTHWPCVTGHIPSKPKYRMSGRGDSYRTSSSFEVSDTPFCEIIMALEVVSRRLWVVDVRPDGCSQSVRVPTDASGVRELLRCRELASGQTRRQAVLHWVRSHRRRVKGDPDAVVEVRQYLRGGREFRWYDLMVTVHESLEGANQ